MRDIDRPAADTGLVDFATFVLVLERWRSTYDPAVVLRSVWRRKVSGGDDTKVGVDVIKEVLTDVTFQEGLTVVKAQKVLTDVKSKTP